MPNGQIRIGIVGAGENTQKKHIPGLLAIEGVKIVGVCNRTRRSTEAVAARYGIPATYDYWTELVEDDQIDAVLIGTWPYLHCPVTMGALANKKHVLCEARMAMNAEQARMMRDAALHSPELVSQVVPAPTTLRVDKMLERLIGSGFIGEVICIEIREFTGFPDWTAPIHWRERSELSGLNIMTLGIWYECLMRWLGEAQSVSAEATTVVKSRRNDQGEPTAVDIPDHLQVNARMECGALAHFTISRVCGFAGPSSLTIYGTDGTIRFSNDTLEAGKRGESMSLVSVPAEIEGGWFVEREFIDSIRNQTPVRRTSFADGVKYMEFTQSVYESIQTGRNVAVRKY